MQSGRGGKREGSGRKKLKPEEKAPPKTRAVRVPVDISDEEIVAIPSLKAAMADWEHKCAKNPKSPRYDFLKTFIQELKGLGYNP